MSFQALILKVTSAVRQASTSPLLTESLAKAQLALNQAIVEVAPIAAKLLCNLAEALLSQRKAAQERIK